jgi:broad specificity phosphatase PhoE
MSTLITLIRHGQTNWNVEGRWQGHAAVPLNEAGRVQAKILARYLQGTTARRMISSDLLRTRETAQIINDQLKLPMSFDKRFREIDVGEWQGLTIDEVKTWDLDRYERFASDMYSIPRPGGESYELLGDRGIVAMNDLANCFPREHTLVVTHGGTIRQIVKRLTGIEIPHSVENTSLTSLTYDKNTWSADKLAITPHLSSKSPGA